MNLTSRAKRAVGALSPRRRAAEKRARTRRRLVLIGVAAAGAGAAAARLRQAPRPERSPWFAVTVLAERAQLEGPDRPDGLARLAERHEVRITSAPGGRGCEIAVRDADGRARQELRELKQLLETGEVLVVAGQPEGHRTVLGRAAVPAFRQLAKRGTR